MDPYSRETVVVLTHPVGDDDLLYHGLIQEGVDVICDPMINTEQIDLNNDDLAVIFKSRRIIFTSKRGVEMIDSVEKIFEKSGAVLKGHFLLSSGMHSPVYWEKFQVLQYPEYVLNLQ